MVLRGGQRHHGGAVSEGQQAALGALEHLFHHHEVAGGAKRAREALVQTGQGLVGVCGHDDALARGQAVGLHHARAAQLTDVVGRCGLVGKALIGGRRHARARHGLLGKLLRAFHLGRVAIGTKARDASRTHGVAHAHYQRRLGANDHQADAVGGCPCGNALGVLLVDRRDLGQLQHAAVTRSNPEPARARRLGKLLQQSVLAAASAKKQDVNLFKRHVNSNLRTTFNIVRQALPRGENRYRT